MRIGGVAMPERVGPIATRLRRRHANGPRRSRSGQSFRGEPAARRPTKAAARRPTSASRRSACPSSGRSSRQPRAARQLSAWRSSRAAPEPADEPYVAKAIARRKPARRTKQSRRRRPGSGPAVVSAEPWATQRGRGSQYCCACGRPAQYPGWTSRRGLSVAKWFVARPRRCLIGCPVCRLRGKLRLTSFVGFS